jgi:hypothetical protein
MFKVVFFVVLAFVFLFFALQHDDEISTETQSLIARLADDGNSEAYLYLLGVLRPGRR